MLTWIAIALGVYAGIQVAAIILFAFLEWSLSGASPTRAAITGLIMGTLWPLVAYLGIREGWKLHRERRAATR